MKTKNYFIIAIVSVIVNLMTVEIANAREKVILDTDMVEVFDDGIAMMMLAKAPNIDLLGVTPQYVHYVWDVIAASILIDPTIIKEEVTRYVDVNAQFGFSYGQALAFSGNQPVGTQQARIILTVDEARLWKMIYDYCANF